MHSRKLGLMASLLAGAGSLWAQVPVGPGTPATVTPPNAVSTAPVQSAVPPAGINASPGPIPSSIPLNNGISSTTMPQGGYFPASALADTDAPIVYGSADYLLWHIRQPNYPALAATLPTRVLLVNAQTFDAGSADAIDTPVILPLSFSNGLEYGGGPKANIGSQNGGRFTLGFWGDSEESWGMEGTFLFLSRGGETLYGRPTTDNDVVIGTGQTVEIFVPSVIGGIGGEGASRSLPINLAFQAESSLKANINTMLMGAEVNGRWSSVHVGPCKVGGLVGARWIGFRDELSTASAMVLTTIPGVPFVGLGRIPERGEILTLDRIRIWNQFFGAQVGAQVTTYLGNFFLDAKVKAGFGVMAQFADVESNTRTNWYPTANGVAPLRTFNGGLLASAPDVGSHRRSRFSFVPEFNGKVGYDVANWLRLYVGYDALYMTGVARAANSTKVASVTYNSNSGVGGTPSSYTVMQPTFRFSDSDLWVQGISFGMEFSY